MSQKTIVGPLKSNSTCDTVYTSKAAFASFLKIHIELSVTNCILWEIKSSKVGTPELEANIKLSLLIENTSNASLGQLLVKIIQKGLTIVLLFSIESRPISNVMPV